MTMLLEVRELPLAEPVTCSCNQSPCQCDYDAATRYDHSVVTNARQQADADAPPLGLDLDDAPIFAPLTDEEAAGIARRASALKHEAEDIRANAKAMVDDLESRLEWLLTAEDQRIREFIARKGGKSRRTLFGLLGTRQVGGGLKIEDLDAAVSYARNLCPDAVITTVTVDPKKLRLEETVDTETGESRPVPPPGFRWDAPVSKIYIQPLPRGGKDTAE